MAQSLSDIASCIGRTPIIKLNHFMKSFDVEVFAKLEFLNPGGSVKDRTALAMVEEAENSGNLLSGGTIIEAGEGNLGLGLAMVAASRGYRTIFVIPDSFTEERRAALRAFGARVHVTPAGISEEDPRSYQSVAKRLQSEISGSVIFDACKSQANRKVHYETTGREIWDAFGTDLDLFVATIGTGGTISGVGRYLKEKNPNINIVGVDPLGSVYYDFFHTGKLVRPHNYLLEGIGKSYIPDTMDFQILDDVFRVTDKEGFLTARSLAREEGLFVGGNSGAAMAGALQCLKEGNYRKALVLLTDSGDREISRIYSDTWMRENSFLDPDSKFGLVRDLVKNMDQSLITVDADARVPEVIGILKLHGISQVPVVRNGVFVGILTENRLLERALRGGSPLVNAGELAESDYCAVNMDTDVVVLLEYFHKARIAVVLEGQKPVGVITRIDLIDLLSKVTKD